MSNLKVVVNRKEARKLLRGEGRYDGVAKDLQRRGEQICDAAGAENHEVQTHTGRNRARVTVRTSTFRGRYAQAKYRRLSSSLDAGR